MDGSVVFARFRYASPPNTCFPMKHVGCILAPLSSTQMASRSIQPFLHSSRQSVPILYNGPPFSLKMAPSHGRISTRFLGTTEIFNANDISMGSAGFWGLTTVTDRPTDHATRSVTIGHIYVCSIMMRPKNGS